MLTSPPAPWQAAQYGQADEQADSLCSRNRQDFGGLEYGRMKGKKRDLARGAKSRKIRASERSSRKKCKNRIAWDEMKQASQGQRTSVLEARSDEGL